MVMLPPSWTPVTDDAGAPFNGAGFKADQSFGSGHGGDWSAVWKGTLALVASEGALSHI